MSTPEAHDGASALILGRIPHEMFSLKDSISLFENKPLVSPSPPSGDAEPPVPLSLRHMHCLCSHSTVSLYCLCLSLCCLSLCCLSLYCLSLCCLSLCRLSLYCLSLCGLSRFAVFSLICLQACCYLTFAASLPPPCRLQCSPS